MTELADMLSAARTPLLILGGTRWSEAATQSVRRFAERFELPVVTSYRRGTLFDALHPNYAGDLGIGPNPKLIARIKNSDLPILIGGRLGEIPSQGFTLFEIARAPRLSISMPRRKNSVAFIRRACPFTRRRSPSPPRSMR